MANNLEQDWYNRALTASKAAHQILAGHEASKSRVVLLKPLVTQLSGTPVDVQDYFREAIRCLEVGCNRAAIVFVWSGFIELFLSCLYAIHESDIRAKRPKWKFRDLTELKEFAAESQLLDVAKDVSFINKANLRILQGNLATRNQCAHPTLYSPSLNFAIGYVNELINLSKNYI
jgi:hypothetical protein